MPAMPTYTPLTPPDGAGNASNPNLHLGDGLVSVLKSDALGERRLLTLCFFFSLFVFAWLRILGCAHHHAAWTLDWFSSRLVLAIITLSPSVPRIIPSLPPFPPSATTIHFPSPLPSSSDPTPNTSEYLSQSTV